MKKKVLALTLSMALLLGSSATVFAAEDESTEGDNAAVAEREISEENVDSVADSAVDAEESRVAGDEEKVSGAVEPTADTAAQDELASGICGENLTWVLAVDGTLTISGEGEMMTDSDISIAAGIPWYEYKESVQRVIIEEGITSVGNYAFTTCYNLAEAEIPNSILCIGEEAFSRCHKLSSIVLPDGLISIGAYAFEFCESLTEVDVPDSVTDIGDHAFGWCSGLEKVTLPDNITDIKNGMFSMCYELRNIELPDNIARIGDGAFSACFSLEEITIPEGVTSIGESAFGYCESLKAFIIPDSVDTIGDFAFSGCSSLASISGLDNVSRIGGDTFSYCTSLTDIGFLEGASSISGGMFIECSGLQNVTVPSSVTNIGYMAFASCNNLENVIIPDNVTSIKEDAFADCTALKNITIPASVTSIGKYALGYSYEESGAGTSYIPIEDFTICGYAGTAAETYAKENAFTFVAITDPEIEIVPEKTDEVYVSGSGRDAVIYCTGNFADFISVAMDGVLVDPANYKVEDGSTVLTFAASYLDTLSVGRHTVTLNYTNDSIDTYFTIVEEEEEGTAGTDPAAGTGNGAAGSGAGSTGGENTVNGTVKTGDQTNIALWGLLGICSAAACSAVLAVKRKRT